VDLHFLAEAKTRSRWKRETEQQAGQGSWKSAPNTKFGPNATWRTKVRQISYDLRLSTHVKKHVFQTFEKLERDHGVGYVDKLDNQQLRHAVKIAANQYTSTEKVLPRELRKPGVSSIYKQPTTLNVRTGLAHPDAEIEAGASKSRTGIGSGDQLRTNVADVELGTLTRKELEKHAHPDVKRMYQAISPQYSKFQRDKAVVWNSEGIPYYMFAKLMKVRAEGPTPEEGDAKFYDFMFPRSMNFKNKAVPIKQLGKYKKETSLDLLGQWNKNTDWRGMYRSDELMKLNVIRGSTTIKPVKKDSLASAAVYAQQVAFGEAKPFMAFRKKFFKARAVLAYFESVEKKHALGAMQEAARKEAFKDYREAEKAMKKLGTNYTWYLYLLALEDEHGVLLVSRQAEHPAWPKTRNEVKGKTKHWTIQYTGSDPIPQWEASVLTKAGYPTHNLSKFYEDLSKSMYKLGRQSQNAVKHLWIPLGGALEKFRLYSHKANIDDYLEKAKIEPANYVFGWEGGDINVLDKSKLGGLKLYRFTGGNPRRAFALLPAMEYLRHFDSPKHSGTRFVHGKKTLTAPQREFDPDDPFKETGRKRPKTKLQKRAASYRMTRVLRRPEHPEFYPDIFSSTFKRDLEQQRKDRIVASVRLIDKAMKKYKQKARARVAFMGRKISRISQAERGRATAQMRLRSKQHGRVTHTGERRTQSAQERETLTKVLAFRRRASHFFPGMSHALRDDKDKPLRWGDTSTKMARERPFTMTTADRVIGKLSGRSVKPTVIKTVKPKMPLPTWKDFLGAPNWKAYWAKKPPGQKKFLLKGSTIRQIKAQVRQDYKDKLKSYVRQAYAEGFIVIDGSGHQVSLSNLHISNRDLV
jgi:hypothetical protein